MVVLASHNLITAPRGTILKYFIREESAYLRSRIIREVTPEPPSSLFVYDATIDTLGIMDAADNLKAQVLSSISATRRPETIWIQKELKEEFPGINLVDLARGGAPYHNIPNKRPGRWERYENELINNTHQLWMRPFWAERALPRVLLMMDFFKDLSIWNMHKGVSNPRALIGEKLPTTGTGFAAPIKNKQDLAKRLSNYVTTLEPMIEQYYDDMKTALSVWPLMDSEIRVNSSMWTGLTATRSDVTISRWDEPDRYEAQTQTRLAGTDPSSTFHTHALNDKAQRVELIDKFMTPFHLPVYKFETFERVYTTPPVTVVDDGEIGVLSLDVGYQWPPARMEKTAGKWNLITPKTVVKLGADNIVLAGITLRASNGNRYAHLISGCPYTTRIYDQMFGEAVADIAYRHHLHVWIVQIGDDVHILCTPEEAQIILAELGPWARIKKWDGMTNFITGRQFIWRDKDSYVVMMTPRWLRSVSSPQQRGNLRMMRPVDTYGPIKVEPHAVAAADDMWKQHRDLVYFDGSPDEYRSILRGQLPEALPLLSKLGQSEWLAEQMEHADY